MVSVLVFRGIIGAQTAASVPLKNKATTCLNRRNPRYKALRSEPTWLYLSY